MIRIEAFHKSFDGNAVLKGLSLNINHGEVMALIGGSGCGKSVLLKHVAGLMKPDQGRVIVDGKDIGILRGRGLRALRDRLGFLFQGGALFDSLTVLENVAFPLKEKTNMSDGMVRKKALEELEHVGLSGSENKYPSQISGGMVKRAAIARALVMEPQIMLFDEPTTGLDPVRGAAILDLIDSCHKRLSFTGILVTHEIKNVFAIVDRVAMLHDGVIRVEGTPQEVMDSVDPVVRAFVDPPVKT
ncbi:MAG: ABC transporter ATP-binding protein [Deltaproteobacteria bacterium]|nr:ABC transporter ATP-binding protein [Deltaproteobacteria bacterium]